jgi:hypothetical protein
MGFKEKGEDDYCYQYNGQEASCQSYKEAARFIHKQRKQCLEAVSSIINQCVIV